MEKWKKFLVIELLVWIEVIIYIYYKLYCIIYLNIYNCLNFINDLLLFCFKKKKLEFRKLGDFWLVIYMIRISV